MQNRKAIRAVLAASVIGAAAASAAEQLHIDAGPDQTVRMEAGANLSGSVIGSASIGWMKTDGPGEVSFAKQHSAATQAKFSQPGEYTLQLGGYETYVVYDSVRITVVP